MPQTPEPAGDDVIQQLHAEIALAAADAQAARTPAAGVRAELRSHTRVLNALREAQVEQGRAIAELRGEFTELRTEMRVGFATLASGMADITTLLLRGDDDR